MTEEIITSTKTKDETKKDIKLILSGLDNAGKTSMLVGLRRMYGFEEDVKKLKPTIRIDYYRRQFLNMRLSFFDMGGQEKFRQSYLRRPIYFEAVNVLIYLIDIQDPDRFDESVEYLGNVLKVLEETEYEQDFPIFVCFSKADFELVSAEMVIYLRRIKEVKDKIKEIHPGFKFEYYSTSIFNLYTIVRMISNGLGQFMGGYSEITEVLQEFGCIEGIKQALFFDHTGLVISDYFKAEGEGLELQNKIDGIISGHLEFFGQLEDQNLEITSTRGTDGVYMNCCYQFNLYEEIGEDRERTDEEQLEIDEKRKKGDPNYANYYFSMIVDLDNSVVAENMIPKAIDSLRGILNRILLPK